MEKYYAINSDLGYVKGLDIEGSLQVGGSLLKTMSDNQSLVRRLYNFIIDNTDHEVSLETITLNVEEVE